MTDPDGFALLLMVACLGLAALVLAAIVETILAGGMRRRMRYQSARRAWAADRERDRAERLAGWDA
jgi:hypothetical protein